MRRNLADYRDLFARLCPPNAIVVSIGPDWDQNTLEDREIEVTVPGALQFIEDVQGAATPGTWEDRVMVTLYHPGTIHLSKPNTNVMSADELDTEAAETELKIGDELARIWNEGRSGAVASKTPDSEAGRIIADGATRRLFVYVNRLDSSQDEGNYYLVEISREAAGLLVADAEENGESVEVEPLGNGFYNLQVEPAFGTG